MDKLRAMQTFIAIADGGSLTAAARALDSSLPAVVRTLAALEEHLRVRLINRTTRRLSLTEEGRAYLESCRHILAALDEAETALSARQSEPAGTLAITAPVLFGQLHVAPIVTGFVARYEQVKCRLMLHDRVVNLLEEGIDVGVRIGPLADSSLIAHRVGSIRRVLVASPELLAHHGVPTHPDELSSANCLRFTGLNATSWTFHEDGRAFTVPVSGKLEFNQVAPTIDACLAGLGFGVFLSYQVASHLAAGRLRLVLEAFEPPPRPVNIVYPHARLLPTRTRVFVEEAKRELKARLGGLPA
ncbi:LysR family transcriptional regulator [Crenobacter cavernae]|uniref:LysR family transcriptional regulator n=1 Tax=Crenobacter cavernae TaxID=2290923 RepID=A0ABY0FGT3_9NEIS|nr:LysR family transcriptional regulator [Crenobacter cavernae]RXZ45520.1 LysR family transcriptional regulator [Crenobacter cavernae]